MKIGPKYKIARRLGSRIFSKTQTTKFSISGTTPRASRGGRSKALSEYASQLIEKQKARYAYGLKEGQFANYIKKVHLQKAGNPNINLYRFLECRLDNIVFRLGLTPSRYAARQMISHGHILVNGRRLNIPSTQIKIGDKIKIRPQSQSLGLFKNLTERLKDYQTPEWVSFDPANGEGIVKAAPVLGQTESDINFGAILEFYSRV